MNFNADYLARLKQRDPNTCKSFVASLTPVLESRLRCKFRDHGSIEDLRNETFYRVFTLVDGGRVRAPEQFGAFVRGVCDRVALESRRKGKHNETLPEVIFDVPDHKPSVDEWLDDQEMKVVLWREIMKLSEADRKLIIELHFEERDRQEMATDRGISVIGLNVRLCRALKRLRTLMLNSGKRPRHWDTMAA
jgi:RNA polymerase sigma-70 factor (ECF subfamily)